jgi:hypothetical protein
MVGRFFRSMPVVTYMDVGFWLGALATIAVFVAADRLIGHLRRQYRARR